MFRTCAPPPGSGDLVERAVSPLGGRQASALGGDGSALHAVCVVDNPVHVAGFVPTLPVLGDLIDSGGAHPAPGLGDLAWHMLAHADVVWRVVAGGVAGDEHRGELVEGVFGVGLW